MKIFLSLSTCHNLQYLQENGKYGRYGRLHINTTKKHAMEQSTMIDNKLIWLKRQLDQSPHTKITGYIGEEIAIELLKQNGWHACRRKYRKGGDLIAFNKDTGEVLKIEVKTAKKSKNGYQFCLKKSDRHGMTDCKYADVVLLLCITPAIAIIPFVMPPIEQKKVCIRNPYTTRKFADYRQSTKCLELSV